MFELAPIWVEALALFAAMTLGSVLGNQLNRHLSSRSSGSAERDESYILSGMFGLLALLMAFAFSLAVGRYEERRELVVKEANALGTLASRLALLTSAQQQALRPELAAYAAARAEAGLIADDAAWEHASTAASARFDRFAVHLYAAINATPPDTRGPLLVQALNTAADSATDRHAARQARLPSEVIVLLALFCVAGATVLGYALETAGSRHAIVSVTFFALLALAFATILDLDRPRSGTILVPQEELIRIAAALAV
jgi:urea transporter